MNAVTVRILLSELARIIHRKASENRMNINRAVIDLLKEGVGIRRRRGLGALHHGLDALAGSCTKKEAAAFERALKRQLAIDPELWKWRE